MTNSSKPPSVTVVLAFFIALSVIFGAGWFQASLRSTAIADRVSAEVFISRHRPRVIGDPEIEPAEVFEIYRQTQGRMVKSQFVLSAVLRNPAIANLELLKEQPQPFKFLEERLEVDFPATEFMRISFDGARSPDAAKIVNAVVTEYLNEVVNSENNARNKRLADLERAHRELSEQLRTRRTTLKKLVKNLQTGDKESLTEKQKMMIELHSALRKERAQRHIDLMNARIRLAAFEEAAKLNPEAEIPEAVVDEQLAVDTEIQRIQTEIKRRQETLDVVAKTSKDPQSATVTNAQASLEEARKSLELLKEKTRLTIVERLRNEALTRAQASKAELRDSVRVAELTIRQLDDEMDRQKVETQQTGEWSLEVETLREDLEQAKAIDQQLTEQIERLKIEMRAEPRVVPYREADGAA
jgi:hypothetical protein